MPRNQTRLVQGSEPALQQMKYEIASEFGVVLGPDTASRQNGSVGGEITKRLVAFAEQNLAGVVSPGTVPSGIVPRRLS